MTYTNTLEPPAFSTYQTTRTMSLDALVAANAYLGYTVQVASEVAHSLNVDQRFAFNTSRSMRTHKWHTACVRTYVVPWRSRAAFFTALLCYWYSLLRFLPSPLPSIGGKMRIHRWHTACIRTYVAPWRSRAVFFTKPLKGL